MPLQLQEVLLETVVKARKTPFMMIVVISFMLLAGPIKPEVKLYDYLESKEKSTRHV